MRRGGEELSSGGNVVQPPMFPEIFLQQIGFTQNNRFLVPLVFSPEDSKEPEKDLLVFGVLLAVKSS